jgi:hypothetical protein
MYLHWPEPSQLLLEAFLETPLPQSAAETGDIRDDLFNALGTVRQLLNQPGMVAVFLQLLARSETDPTMAVARDELNSRADNAILGLLAAAHGAEPTDRKVSADPSCTDPSAAICQLLGPLMFRRLVQAQPVDDTFTRQVVDAFLASRWEDRAAPPGEPVS